MGLGSGIRDPGSGKNLSRIQGSKRHRIPDPQHWSLKTLGAITPPVSDNFTQTVQIFSNIFETLSIYLAACLGIS
jgi:hypothetical protein